MDIYFSSYPKNFKKIDSNVNSLQKANIFN